MIYTHDKSIGSSGAWSTSDELTFLTHLGSWLLVGKQDKPGVSIGRHLELLRGYQRSLKKRVVWTGLDRPAIEKFVSTRIEKFSKMNPNTPLPREEEAK